MINADLRLQVPGHRGVNRNGLLTGKIHYDTPTKMQELLELEGITIENDSVKDFEKVLWDPLIEL